MNDFASLIPAREKKMMENISREVLQKTGIPIVIATVDTVGDSDYETYANELYADWVIGKKGEVSPPISWRACFVSRKPPSSKYPKLLKLYPR